MKICLFAILTMLFFQQKGLRKEKDIKLRYLSGNDENNVYKGHKMVQPSLFFYWLQQQHKIAKIIIFSITNMYRVAEIAEIHVFIWKNAGWFHSKQKCFVNLFSFRFFYLHKRFFYLHSFLAGLMLNIKHTKTRNHLIDINAQMYVLWVCVYSFTVFYSIFFQFHRWCCSQLVISHTSKNMSS